MLLLALYAAGVAVWQWGFGAPGGAWVSDLAFLPLALGVGALAWLTARTPGLDPASRRGWRLIALSYLAYWLGDLLWLYYDGIQGLPATPSWADLFYLMQYPLLLAGILLFRPGSASPRQRFAFWIDAATVVLVGLVITWDVVLAPQPAGGDLAAHVLAVAYPIGDLLMFVGVALALLQERRDGTGRALAVLGVGLLLAFAGDLVYGSQNLAGTYRSGGVPDLLWLLSLVVVGSGAWLGKRRAAAADAGPAVSPIPLHLLPYGAVGICLLVLIVGGQEGAAHRELDVATAVVVLFVLLRQLVVLQQNRRLLHEEAGLRAELEQWAFYDALTHLANRTLLCNQVEQALREPARRGEPIAVLYLDLDGFKRVNDSLGHRAGDELLVLVASRLKDCVTPADTVARLGGDEF
ncbi:MAG TPA: GGDEF domain-containing protein, partial [Symbiobacteriaceae bacterium]|nr:GGDEF domain-containing protein [Symbiobacteriaceae bacterium]